MKKGVSFLLVFLLITAFWPVNLFGAKSKNDKKVPEFVPGQVIVKLKEGSFKDDSPLRQTLNKLGLKKEKQLFKNRKKQDFQNIFSFEVDESKTEQAVQELKALNVVQYAEKNFLYKTDMVPNDPFYHSTGSWGQSFDDLWGVKKIQPEAAWDVSLGENVPVAVIDSGVDYNHEDLAQNVWNNAGEIGADISGNDKKTNGIDDDNNGYIDDWHGWDTTTITTELQGWSVKITGAKGPDNDPMDDAGHGTHVSGTIATIGNNNVGVVGVAPQAKIMPVKFLTKDGVGTSEDAAAALVYAADNGAKVINNSWGGSYSQLIGDAVKYAHGRGSVIIASAGNSNLDNWGNVPASLLEVITVSATDYQDSKASFSSFGKVDVAAPGVDILSSKSSLDDYHASIGENYTVASGTSMASPHVAGLAALILAQRPGLSNEEVRQVITESADDLGDVGFDQRFGHGRINAARALGQIASKAVILSPVGRVEITNAEIKGSAASSNFTEYTLEYGAGDNPTSWSEIRRSATAVENDVLANWDLSSLSFGRYSLRLRVFDASGAIYENISRVDYDIPFAITNIQANVFSPTETILSWDINREPTDTWVEYGLDTNYGQKSYGQIPYGSLGASTQILGLSPGTTYHYRTVSEEFAHQIKTEDATFTTPLPTFSIFNIQVNPEPHKAIVSWETSIPTTGVVQYNGTDWVHDIEYNYRQEASDQNLSTTHSVILTNLGDSQEYILIVKAQDSLGNGITTEKMRFNTPAGQYASLTSHNYQSITENSATLSFDTDIPATVLLYGYIDYDTTIDSYNFQPINITDNNLSTHHEIIIGNLWPAAEYYLSAELFSADGGRSFAGFDKLATPESSHISNLRVENIADATAGIRWQTDVSSSSVVQYWEEPYNYGDIRYRSGCQWSVVDHECTLSLLSPNTHYAYRVQSVENDNYYLSGVRYFTTLAEPPDTVAPSGAITINNNTAYTNSTTVTLDASASDNAAVTEMQFSADGIVYLSWESYQTSKTWNLTPGDGTKTVYAKFRDAAGNESSVASDTIILDQTAPAISAPQTTSPTENHTPAWAWASASDGLSGIEGPYKFYLGTTPGGSDIVNGADVTGTSYTYSGSLPFGTYYAYIAASDNAGNLATSSVNVVTIKDLIAPTGSIKINNNVTYANSTTATLNLSASDNIAVTEMQFSNDEIVYSLWEAYAASKSWTLPSGDGTKTVYAKYRDAAGNKSVATSDAIILDQTAPAVFTPQTTTPTENHTPIWTWSPASDSLSGFAGTYKFYLGTTSGGSDLVNGVETTSTSYAYPGSLPFGTYYAHITVSDNAGNIEVSSAGAITIKDLTVPVGSIKINNNAVYTNSIAATLSLAATDNIAVTEMQFSNDEIVYSPWEAYQATKSWNLPSDDGTKTVYAKFRDAVGNISIAASDAITLDRTSPAGLIKINNEAAYTNATAVTLNLVAFDNIAVTQMQFSNDEVSYSPWEAYAASKSWTLSSGDGSKTVYVRYKDVAGNISQVYSDAIVLDQAKPTGSILINNGDSKTTSKQVTLKLNSVDSLSGVLEMSFSNNQTTWTAWEPYQATKSWTLLPGKGTKYVYVKYRDRAGNISGIYSGSISLTR